MGWEKVLAGLCIPGIQLSFPLGNRACVILGNESLLQASSTGAILEDPFICGPPCWAQTLKVCHLRLLHPELYDLRRPLFCFFSFESPTDPVWETWMSPSRPGVGHLRPRNQIWPPPASLFGPQGSPQATPIPGLALHPRCFHLAGLCPFACLDNWWYNLNVVHVLIAFLQ